MALHSNGRGRNRRWQLRAARFLVTAWSHHREGYAFIAARKPGSSRWRSIALPVFSCASRIARVFDVYDRADWDLYFTPNAFCEPFRRARLALPSRLAWVDVDEANPNRFRPPPNVLWETSPGRCQALWVFSDTRSVEESEAYSAALACNFGADPTGWTSTKLLRVPYTYNHKRTYDRPTVRLLRADWPRQRRLRLGTAGARPRAKSLELDIDPTVQDAAEVLGKYRLKLHPRCRALIRSRKCHERDRSKCIFEIIAGLHDVGASPEEIAAVVWASPYFISKHGRDERRLNEELSRVLAKLGAGS
jgi:hypothetical protein